MVRAYGLAALLAFYMIFASVGWADEIEEGRKLFKYNCYTCHVQNDPYATLGKSGPAEIAVYRGDPAAERYIRVQNVWGPDLRGIVGAKAGRAVKDGFRYSEPFLLKTAGMIWTEGVLDLWITDTFAMVPGTWMRFKVKDPEKRRKIIAWLKTYK